MQILIHKHMKINPVTHFEIPYEDKQRMAEFYEKTFGWKARMLGEDMENYVLVTAAEANEKGFPKELGRINGGFYEKSPNKPNQYPSVVIAVEDIKEAMDKIQTAGGKILGEPWNIKGYGIDVSFLDTGGNRLSVMQPTMQM